MDADEAEEPTAAEGFERVSWRRLAESVLAAYGLTAARITPLRGLKLQGVFQIDAREQGARARFVLRVHGPGEDRLTRNGASFGLMHGDLHPCNLLFHQDAIRAIYFEGCGSDSFLYDLASSLVEGTAGWHILTPDGTSTAPAFAARRDALLRGYAAVRPLPDDGTAQLPTFIAVRALSSLPWRTDWAATRTDDGWTRMVLDARLRYLRAYHDQ